MFDLRLIDNEQRRRTFRIDALPPKGAVLKVSEAGGFRREYVIEDVWFEEDLSTGNLEACARVRTTVQSFKVS